MTKDELGKRLAAGELLQSLLPVRPGQGCEICKAERFQAGPDVIYVPDLWLNDLPADRPATPDEIADILSHCRTGDDFLDLCGRDAAMAEALFDWCDWQHPSTVMDEGFPFE